MHTVVQSAAVALILAFLLTPSFAGIYVWTDENGKKHYSDKKPVANNNVREIAEPRRRSAPKTASAKSKNRSQNTLVRCNRSLRACESQWRDEYSYRKSLCRGDWSAAAAMGNAMYGGNRTGQSMAQDCKKEARTRRDDRLQSCSKSYQMCMKT